jgi:hydrogenase expression/formation protein HypC
MCLAVPGKIMEITEGDAITRIGRVSFGGTVREVNLAFVPDVVVGNYVLVHAGVAINAVDEAEAQQVFAYLQEIYGDDYSRDTAR